MTDFLAGAADGALYLLQSALALAAIVATTLVLWGLTVRHAAIAAVAFAAIAFATVWLPPLPANVLSPAVLLGCGVLLAIGLDWPPAVRAVAAAAGAVTAGIAGGVQSATWAEATGATLVLVLLVFVLLLPSRVIPRRMPWLRVAQVGRRMAGAWIAAVGALLLVLTVRGIDLGGKPVAAAPAGTAPALLA